jgi:hypothetical protein
MAMAMICGISRSIASCDISTDFPASGGCFATKDLPAAER